MKPLNKKVKAPKKALRVESKNSVIEEDFIALGIDCPEIGTVSATGNGKSQVDFDAFYIKKADEGKEKCVYFRKIGAQARVLFAEKKDEGHIPFLPYVLSEFSLNELLHGTDRRAQDGALVLADRVLGENELKYISAFMPEEHPTKRKKGISMALSDDEQLEYTAFYWKKGKSVPCADIDTIPELFEALEIVTFNDIDLTLPEPEEPAKEEPVEGLEETEVVEEKAEVLAKESEIIADEEEAIEEELPTAEEAAEGEVTEETEKAEPEKAEEIAQENAEVGEEPEEIEPEKSELIEEEIEEPDAPKKEKKPKKESFFARRRKNKQLKKKKESQKEEIEQALPEQTGEEISEPEPAQVSDEEPVEDEISAEEAEALVAAMPMDLFSEQELEDIFENPFDDETEETEEPETVIEEQSAETEAEHEEISEKEQKPEVTEEQPAEVSGVLDEINEKAEELAEETEIIADEEEIIAEESEILEEAEEEIAETKLEIIEEKKPAKKEKHKKSSFFAKKAKKKKVSEPEVSAKKAKKTKEKKKKQATALDAKLDDELKNEEEISLEEVQVLPEKPAGSEEKFSVEDFFESEKPLTLLQILEAAEISNENKKTFLQYMIPALMNTVYVVPITDSGEHANAVYVSRKAADLLETEQYPTGENKELIFPDDEREELRKHIKLKTIMSSGEAYIPAFTSTEMFEQIFGKAERCGLFAFPNLCSQTRKNEQIKGVIINPEITDLKFSQEELKDF